MNNTALVTGACSGIGKATAGALARLGWKVVIHGRTETACRETMKEIQLQNPAANLDLIVADLSEMNQVERMAAEVNARFPELKVLINNAGTFSKARALTSEGLELTWAVNYLSRFLLTNSLLDLLRKNAPSRIVDISGAYHSKGVIHFNDLSLHHNYSMAAANNQSKLANVLFTYKLARMLEGSGVTINTLHPGAVNTGTVLKSPGFSGFSKWMYRMVSPFFNTPEQGAKTSVYLASSPEVENVSGRYFVHCQERRSSDASYDVALQEKLWEESEKMVNFALKNAKNGPLSGNIR